MTKLTKMRLINNFPLKLMEKKKMQFQNKNWLETQKNEKIFIKICDPKFEVFYMEYGL